jgi:hypothetical protein
LRVSCDAHVDVLQQLAYYTTVHRLEFPRS